MTGDRSSLLPGEPHPAAFDARAYLQTLSSQEQAAWLEAFSSCAIEGNRLGEVCAETLRRVMHGEPVSDRYLLGLAWTIHKHTKEGESDELS